MGSETPGSWLRRGRKETFAWRNELHITKCSSNLVRRTKLEPIQHIKHIFLQTLQHSCQLRELQIQD